MMTFMPRPTPHRSIHPHATQTALSAATGSALAGLIQRAQWLHTLDETLRRSLPAPLAAHCRLGNVRDDTLVFLVDSPTWKAKLRLYGDALLAAAATAGIPARKLTVKIAPLPTTPLSAAVPVSLSPAGRDALRSAAQSIDDPDLRAKLLQLASVP